MTDRLKDAWKQILSGLLPALATYVRWEYRVTGVQPGPPVLVSGSPVSAACPFGTLAKITLWPGPSGAYAIPAAGSLVLVEFHEGDPSKPSVCGLDPNVPPTQITLGKGSTPIAREGDTVTISIAQWNAASPTAPSSGGAVTISNPVQATIQTGSQLVVSQ